MTSIYRDVLKLNEKPVMAKLTLMIAAIAGFEALFLFLL